jgi:hypothetical protein
MMPLIFAWQNHIQPQLQNQDLITEDHELNEFEQQ